MRFHRHVWAVDFRDGELCEKCGTFRSSEELVGGHVVTFKNKLREEYWRGYQHGIDTAMTTAFRKGIELERKRMFMAIERQFPTREKVEHG